MDSVHMLVCMHVFSWSTLRLQ